jgi:hypothetical protein
VVSKATCCLVTMGSLFEVMLYIPLVVLYWLAMDFVFLRCCTRIFVVVLFFSVGEVATLLPYRTLYIIE